MCGWAARPRRRRCGGRHTLDGGKFGDFNAPFLQGVVDYADRRLEANLLLWRTGKNVLGCRGDRFPWTWRSAERSSGRWRVPCRCTPEETASISGILEALTPGVRRVSGMFSADVNVSGTWEAPRFAGAVESSDGAMSLPGLGVRYDGLTGVGPASRATRWCWTTWPSEAAERWASPDPFAWRTCPGRSWTSASGPTTSGRSM